MTFIFEEIDEKTGHALKLKNYWYYFNFYEKEISVFKTRYRLNILENAYPYILKSRKYVYVIDFSGKVLFKTLQNNLEQNLKNHRLTCIFNDNKETPDFNTTNYDRVRFICKWNNMNYYTVVKNKKLAVVDEIGNIVIDFNYSPLYVYQIKDEPRFIIQNPQTNLEGIIDIDKNVVISTKYKNLSSFCFDNNIYLCAKNVNTNLCGVIDIDENVIIPFMYDSIHIWNIDEDRKTIQVEKNNKCGLIDIYNNTMLDFKYQYIFGFIGEYSFAKDEKSKWGVINRQGIEINFDIEDVKDLKLKGKLL